MYSRFIAFSSAFALVALLAVAAIPVQGDGDYDPAFGKPSDCVPMYNKTMTKPDKMPPDDTSDRLLEDVRTLKNAKYAKCGGFCRFKFCGAVPNSFWISFLTDVSFTPAICDKQGTIVGLVRETGEAHVMVNPLSGIPISKYTPFGLLKDYPADFFKSYQLGTQKRSGVGHIAAEENQLDFFDKKCVILPLTKYDVMDNKDNIIDEVNPNDYPFINCVGFMTRV